MSESTRQTLWYWCASAALLTAGGGLLLTPEGDPRQGLLAAIQATAPEPDLEGDEAVRRFRQFCREVAQLTREQQQEVWQQFQQRADSLGQREMVSFWALPEDAQQAALDQTIDYLEARRRWRHAERFRERMIEEGNWPDWREASFDGLEGGLARFAEVSAVAPPDVPGLKHFLGHWESDLSNEQAMRSEFYRLLRERRAERGLPERYRRGD